MARFVGKKVLLVGRAEASDGSTMTVKTSDDKMVTVALATQFVEFEGMVEGVDKLTEVAHVDFGNEFDMYTYNELAKEANGKSAALFM